MGRRTLLLGLLALCYSGCEGSRAGTSTYPAVKLKGAWHTVKPEETLAQLSRRYGVPLEDVEEINGLQRGAPLAPGRQIFLPGTPHPASHKSVSPTPVGKTPVGKAPAAKQGGKGTFAWPVKGGGKLSSRFGLRGKRPHEGIDIAAPPGTAVLASADGTVIYSGSGVRGYGNLILIQHKGGMVSVYAHNRKNLVKEGRQVRRGQIIGEVGRSGRASGNHLHFEIRRGETPLNPLDFTRP